MKLVKVPALELFLHEMIPLAKAMGVGVELSDARALTLTAPKEQNKNSLNTAFGGSLVSLATLAGYGVVWELMKNKHDLDLTGNGLNHPNDFGHRLYAQTILSVLIERN